MSHFSLDRIREAIRGENVDGWLFWNFHHRDNLADELLGLDSGAVNSRPWLYAVPAQGEPLRIVHAIEARILDALPGTQLAYTGRDAFREALRPLAGKRWAVHLSADIPVISFLDAGTAQTLADAGLELVSAAALIQRLKGLLDAPGMAGHERAAAALYAIVGSLWSGVRRAYRRGSDLSEGRLRRLILEGMEKQGLQTDHPPIVAAGAHSGDPHYDFAGEGARIRRGDVIQLDLWAKEKAENAIYADISWVGVFDDAPAAEVERSFADLVAAREAALSFISDELSAQRRPRGAAVDRLTRSFLIERGYEAALRHRTGHGIDTECHGSGANIDAVEFPDDRLLLDGACFSLEPGIYFDRYGLRTEIDVYISAGKARVSGADRQFSLLTC